MQQVVLWQESSLCLYLYLFIRVFWHLNILNIFRDMGFSILTNFSNSMINNVSTTHLKPQSARSCELHLNIQCVSIYVCIVLVFKCLQYLLRYALFNFSYNLIYFGKIKKGSICPYTVIMYCCVEIFIKPSCFQ